LIIKDENHSKSK